MDQRRKPRSLKLEWTAPARLPTGLGTWEVVAFRDRSDRSYGGTDLAIGLGRIRGAAGLPIRVHSECLTSEVFGSKKCDCKEQLALAMRQIRRLGRGLIIYLRQEGRGIGLFDKIRAYHLQDRGYDTVEANHLLGLPDDARDYHLAAAYLKHLKVRSVRLMTNNPAKERSLKDAGVRIIGRMPLRIKPNRFNRGYLRVKKQKMRHDL